MGNLAPFDRPSDAVVSDVTRGDLSNMSHMKTGSAMLIATSTVRKSKLDASANKCFLSVAN